MATETAVFAVRSAKPCFAGLLVFPLPHASSARRPCDKSFIFISNQAPTAIVGWPEVGEIYNITLDTPAVHWIEWRWTRTNRGRNVARFRSFPQTWPNKPGKNVRPSVCMYVRTSTIKLNAATNQNKLSQISQARFLISSYLSSYVTSKFAKKSTSSDVNKAWYDVRGWWDIHDDMTVKVIWGQGQGEEMTSFPYREYFWRFMVVCDICLILQRIGCQTRNGSLCVRDIDRNGYDNYTCIWTRLRLSIETWIWMTLNDLEWPWNEKQNTPSHQPCSTKLLKAVKMQQNLRIWTLFEIIYTWMWRLYFVFPSEKNWERTPSLISELQISTYAIDVCTNFPYLPWRVSKIRR